MNPLHSQHQATSNEPDGEPQEWFLRDRMTKSIVSQAYFACPCYSLFNRLMLLAVWVSWRINSIDNWITDAILPSFDRNPRMASWANNWHWWLNQWCEFTVSWRKSVTGKLVVRCSISWTNLTKYLEVRLFSQFGQGHVHHWWTNISVVFVKCY